MKAAQQQVSTPSNNGGNNGGGPGHMLGGPGGANTPSIPNSPPPSGGILGGKCVYSFHYCRWLGFCFVSAGFFVYRRRAAHISIFSRFRTPLVEKRTFFFYTQTLPFTGKDDGLINASSRYHNNYCRGIRGPEGNRLFFNRSRFSNNFPKTSRTLFNFYRKLRPIFAKHKRTILRPPSPGRIFGFRVRLRDSPTVPRANPCTVYLW